MRLFKNRYIPEFEWSSSWVYNAFRVWESIFGRKFGIKAESVTEFVCEYGRIEIQYKFYTLEAFLVNLEFLARKFLAFKLVRVEITQFQLATPFASKGLPLISFAIAADTSVAGADTTATWSHTVTGSNPGIHISLADRNGSTTAASYGGSAATSVGSISGPVGFWQLYSWWKPNCATGANNVSLTTTSGAYRGGSASYSGVSTGSVDSSNTHAVSGIGTNTASTTVVAANCWLIAVGGMSSANTASITSNRTDRKGGSTMQFFSGAYASAISDSNATVATGSQSIIYTPTGGSIQDSAVVVFSIAPFIPTLANGSFLLNLI